MKLSVPALGMTDRFALQSVLETVQLHADGPTP
jgi:hypothetical protein